MDDLEGKKNHIMLLIDYATDPHDRAAAKALVEKHGSDHIALNIFREFYSYLPEAKNDAVRLLRKLDDRQGVFLIAATTTLDTYIYAATAESAEFLGPHAEGIWDGDVLEFFGLTREEALAAYRDLKKFPLYVPAHMDLRLCPVCSVRHGEYHRFGCALEVCPWCGGQLANCACRFEVLGCDRLSSEAQLDTLLRKAEEKGRVPFNASEQALTRPGG